MSILDCKIISNKENPIVFTKSSISIPIPICNATNKVKKYEDEYALNCNNFNPSKISPPDLWKSRLEERIKKFYLSDDCKI